MIPESPLNKTKWYHSRRIMGGGGGGGGGGVSSRTKSFWVDFWKMPISNHRHGTWNSLVLHWNPSIKATQGGGLSKRWPVMKGKINIICKELDHFVTDDFLQIQPQFPGACNIETVETTIISCSPVHTSVPPLRIVATEVWALSHRMTGHRRYRLSQGWGSLTVHKNGPHFATLVSHSWPYHL